MKSLLLKASIFIFAISGYIAAPFVTAWSIREAARNGDTAYLTRTIDWASVRETLKPTLSQIALDIPDPSVTPATKPGLWQRMKTYWGQGAVNRAIDGYVTPEGLPQLFAMRKTYRDYMGTVDESKSLPAFERMKRFMARVKRAEFTSLTGFEVDMADKSDPNRIYLGKLQLTGSGWMLKELRIKMLTTAAVTEPAQLMTTQPVAPRAMRAPAKPSWSPSFISRAEAASLQTEQPRARAIQRGNAGPSFWDRAKAAAR